MRETQSPWQEWVGAYPPLGECPLNSSLRFEPRDLWSHELVLRGGPTSLAICQEYVRDRSWTCFSPAPCLKPAG